jgi:uncharacterized protein (TIGR01319 family)
MFITSSGEFRSLFATPTTHDDIAAGAEAAIAGATPPHASALKILVCSSAGGGLRVAVIGLEPELTVEAGRRAAATAGARIVGSFAGVLDSGAAAKLAESAPDVILLTGGTNGGDRSGLVANAQRLPNSVPVVVAGNEDVSAEVSAALQEDGRVVRVVPNVLPEIGRSEVGAAQHAIRELFVDHVIGRGRFASTSPLSAAIRMPTPSAVLAGARVLARLGSVHRSFRAPVVVDVGGATTDVHSVLPPPSQGRARAVVPDSEITRTVEGDLGLRENAESLVDEAGRSGYVVAVEEGKLLRRAAVKRAGDRTFLPSDGAETEADRRLATLAAGLALARHAGELRIHLSEQGATLRLTGRDLRAATCVVGTGGVFDSSEDSVGILEAALEAARSHGALVPDNIPLLIDRNHTLAAAGLLEVEHSPIAATLLTQTFAGGFERVA